MLHFSASNNEAFGLVNIEALSVGTPIMAINTGGIAEIVVDGKNGHFYSIDNPEVFLLNVRNILMDFDSFSKEARNSFTSNYCLSPANVDNRVDQIEALM